MAVDVVVQLRDVARDKIWGSFVGAIGIADRNSPPCLTGMAIAELTIIQGPHNNTRTNPWLDNMGL